MCRYFRNVQFCTFLHLLCIGLLSETQSDYCNLLKSPPKKKTKTPCAGSCVCFYFSFVFSDITFHTSPAQNRLPSCRCPALFRAQRAFTNLRHLPVSWTSCQCGSHILLFVLSAHLECYIRVWSVPHLPVLMFCVQQFT